MSITRDFKLSLVAGRSVPLVINANQYDDGEIWRFTLLDENGQKYSPSTGSIIGLKSDGHIIANAGTVSSTGLVIIPETEQMTAAVGKNFYELLIDDDTHGTANFIVFVEPRPGADGTPSDSDLAVFQEAIDAAATIGDVVDLVDDVAVLEARMDEFARLPDGSLSTAADAELVDIRVGADGTTYSTAGDSVRGQVGDLKNDLSDLNEQLDMETVNPVNVFDGTYTGVIPPSSASGSDTTNANNSTTDFIEAEYADKVYCGYTGNVANALLDYKPVFITEYDANKQWLYRSSQFPSTLDENSKYIYTVTQAETKYIRVSFANTLVTTSGRMFEIAINIDTSTGIYYTEYFKPYTISKRFYDMEHLLEADIENKIIDCWGDSRTEMIASESTSFCDYLQALLGDTYNVCNYGISSQSSGMCAARLGSNEVFVTLAGNQIPASGEVALTGIKCSSGNNRNLYAYSSTAYIPCMLNGVAGRLSRASISTYDNVKFLRDSDGGNVRVLPRTKIVVPDMGSKHHVCVLWFGKNDFASAGNYVVSGILDNYAKAVKYLGHKKYVILGETCSIGSSYEPGGADRAKLDMLNSTLAETYPDNYIDINAWLSSENALTSVGLTATATDLEYIAKGFPCYQLMVNSTNPSDITHPNAKGREAIAHKLYEWMSAKDWFA